MEEFCDQSSVFIDYDGEEHEEQWFYDHGEGINTLSRSNYNASFRIFVDGKMKGDALSIDAYQERDSWDSKCRCACYLPLYGLNLTTPDTNTARDRECTVYAGKEAMVEL